MAIRHVVTIEVAPGKAAEFATAFQTLQALAKRDDGCEQYELFQSLDDPNKVVLLERWASEELLARHMAGERDNAAVDAIVALWAPGTTPTIERFEV
jgi:quinol monooxygenase YgiN